MESTPIDIGTRRELFVDHCLIDALDGLELKLHEPHPGEVAVRFDDPWEDGFSFYPRCCGTASSSACSIAGAFPSA